MSGRLLVVTGPPGAGKTTTSRLLADQFDPSVLVVGDEFFGFLARGAIPPWTAEASRQNDVVIETAAGAAGSFARGGYTTIYEGIVGPWYLSTFARNTGLADIDYVILLPELDDCLHRMLTRRGHDFRDEAAGRHMYEQFAASEIDERHVLRDPPKDPQAVAAAVMTALEEGRLRYVPQPEPQPQPQPEPEVTPSG